MTTWKKQIESLRQVREKATLDYRKAPILKSDWPVFFNDVANVRGIRIIGEYKSVSCGDEAEFIVAAANRWNDLLRVIEVMGEAIQKELKPGHWCGEGCTECRLEKAFDKASRLLSGEGEEK